jgi:hypothetical protein
VTPHLADAAELAEMLGFISQWLACDAGPLEASLAEFAGHPACTTTHLRGDLDRFIFLLGQSDGEDLFGGGDEPVA